MNYNIYKPDYGDENGTGYVLLANFETIKECISYIDNNKSISGGWSWLYISRNIPKKVSRNNFKIDGYMLYNLVFRWLKYNIK